MKTSHVMAFAMSTFGLLASTLAAQVAPSNEPSPRLLLKYAEFDPLQEMPPIAASLRGNPASQNLWLVQFADAPTEADRRALVDAGAEVHQYMPDHAYVVRMPRAVAERVRALDAVRWAGSYAPAFRLERDLHYALAVGAMLPPQRYNIVVVDKHNDKPALAAAVRSIGGQIDDEQEGSLLFQVTLNGAQLEKAAGFDQVLWIDRWTPDEEDIDNGRIQGGANYVESLLGYSGQGVRGHIYEGLEAGHPDWTTTPVNVSSTGNAQSHGHATAGIVFGNGTSNPIVRGLAPDLVGFYTEYQTVIGSRNSVINQVVNTHEAMFTTASWGGGRTLSYTSTSADSDDIIFDHRIPWTQSQSNAGNQQSRPQAWAKNIFSIGGVAHRGNADPADDSWNAGNGSTGPAADGRIKPDLCAYYDGIGTSDRSGSAGYSSSNWTSGFGGTSGATPMVAGHNAIAIQMYTDGIFGNALPVPGGTRFENRPLAQTLKALMIAGAEQYTFNASSSDNRREHCGWGFPSLRNLYDSRNNMLIVPEDVPLTQGQSMAYTVDVDASAPELKVCMTFLEPAGNPAATQAIVNDLSLRVTSPSGVVYNGNVGLESGNYSTPGGSANTIDSVENVFVQNPEAGLWLVEVTATRVSQDAHVATAATDATFALVAIGGAEGAVESCASYSEGNTPNNGSCEAVPFGGSSTTAGSATLSTLFASNNGGSTGGTVFFDVTVTNPVMLTQLDVNTGTAAGTPISVDIFMTALGGTHVGNEGTAGAWTQIGTANGVAAAQDSPSVCTIAGSLTLMPGTYGIALGANGFGHRYTNGDGSNQNYADANLQLAFGSASNGRFATSLFSPRVANINLRYASGPAMPASHRYQTLIPAGQISNSGLISGLAFGSCGTGTHEADRVEIRMSHVPAGSSLSNVFALNLPSAVTVYSSAAHSWSLVAGEWNEIGMTTPFNYDGSSDLVIEVISWQNDSVGVGAVRGGTGAAVFAADFTGLTPPAIATGNSSSGLKVRLDFGCANLSVHGANCGGLTMSMSGSSALGQSYNFDLTNGAPSSSAVFHLGATANGLFPIDLAIIGFPGCFLHNDVLAAIPVATNAAGATSLPFIVVNDPAVTGVVFYGHYAQLLTSPSLTIGISNMGRAVYGPERL